MLKTESLNIFDKLDTKDFKHLRKRIIEMVLATDMANHGKLIGILSSKHLLKLNPDSSNGFNLKEYLEENKEANKFEIQQDAMNFMLHAIDIGHAAKPFELEIKWADCVTAEFLNQGDTEKKLGLPVSFLCDRNTSNVPASQVGFIAGLVLPAFQLAAKLLPKAKHYVELIQKSKEEWEKLKNKS